MTDLEKIVKTKLLVDKMVRGRFKVSYRHSKSTDSYYIILSNADGLIYNLRFSDHKSNDKKYRTFYFENLGNKSKLEKFIEKGIKAMELKQVKYLFSCI